MKFLNNINLSLNEIQNVKLHTLATAPTGYEGLIYYDSALKRTGVYMNGTQKYLLTYDLLAAASGIATLNASSKVVQDPASAATVSGGAAGVIPITPAGGRLDSSFLPTLNNIAAPINSVAMNSQKITGLADPTLAQDAATKAYVDAMAQGLDSKVSVRAATTANITLSGAIAVDGVTTVIGDRVLVKDQTVASANGIYIVGSGAQTRASDADTWAELVSAYTFVEEGTANADTGWTCIVNAGGTLGTTDVSWAQFSSAGTVTGANVGAGTGTIFRDKTGTSINFKSIAAASTKISIVNNTDSVSLDVNEAALVFANMTSSGTLAVAKGGTGTTTSTGTGSVVLSNSPALVTPSLGAATATTINKVTITAPATSATLTLAQGSTLALVGAYVTTLTATAATNVTLPTSGTLLSTANAVTVAQGGTGATTVAGAKTNLGFMTRYAIDIGNGSLTTIPVTHGLGSLDVTIAVYEKAGNAQVYPEVSLTDSNTISIEFSVAPTASQYRVVVIG